MGLDPESARIVATWPAEDRRAFYAAVAAGPPEADGGPPLSEVTKAELQRRLALSAEHPEQARPWDEVYARLVGK